MTCKRAIVLFVAGWLVASSVGAMASSIELKCDRAVRLDASLDVPVQELSMAVVDHVAANALAPLDSGLNARRVPRTTIDSPRVAAILEQIFEKQIDTAADVPDLMDPDITVLIEEKSPIRLQRQPAVDSAASESVSSGPERSSDDSPDISAQLPGFDDDESSRFRREMFRTDI